MSLRGYKMQLHNTITRDNLRILMNSFYTKTLQNHELRNFFVHELGEDIKNEDWIEHIETLADFWLATLLDEGPYEGNFVGMHIKIPHISRSSFITWMELFSISTDEIYIPKLAQQFKNQGMLLSEKFINELKL